MTHTPSRKEEAGERLSVQNSSNWYVPIARTDVRW